MVFSWTQDLTARFINAVLGQVIRLGASFQGNFKKAIWNRIVRDFNHGLPDDQTRDRKQLHKKMAELKKKYRVYSAMKSNSGFGWDPSTDMPTAPDSVWEDVIAAHPQAREFRIRPLFMYLELDTILSQTTATGSFAVYNEEVVGRSRSAPSSLSEFSDSDDGDETEYRSSITGEDAVGHTGQRRHSRNFADHEFKAEDASEDRAAIDQRGVVRRQSVVGRGTPAKRQKTTGEKISESMRVMAEAQESIAVSILTRHNKGRQLSCSDEAIKVFKNMFTDKIPVDQRFRFIKLLATEPNAATMFYGMNDESREYMVRQYLLADNSDSDDN